MDARPRRHEESLWIGLSDGERIAIQIFPHDRGFARDVARALKAIGPSPASELDALASLRKVLRAWYPRLEIHPREALAGLAPHERLWYVLRDGRVRRADDQTNRLHAALSNARQTSADSDTAVAHARAALDFAGQPRPGRGRGAIDSSVLVADPPALDLADDDPDDLDAAQGGQDR